MNGQTDHYQCDDTYPVRPSILSFMNEFLFFSKMSNWKCMYVVRRYVPKLFTYQFDNIITFTKILR